MKSSTSNNSIFITTAAMLISVGVLLPQIFHLVPSVGSMLLPMHIPVIICGFVLGSVYGGICGFLTPLISWAIFGMPEFPSGLIPMLFELTSYGIICGVAKNKVCKMEKSTNKTVYLTLIIAMLIGRVVNVLFKLLVLSLILSDSILKILELALFSNFVESIPGGVLQLLLVPIILAVLKRAGILKRFIQAKEKNNTENEEILY